MPSSCAVVITSIQAAAGSLPLVSTQRTSSSRISAAVPGSESRPAARARVSHSRTGRPVRADAVHHLHRRERVHVNVRAAPLDLVGQVEVGGAGQVRVDAALHADFGSARVPGLGGPVTDLAQRQRVGVGVAAALRERAEPAAGVADVGEVDVAGDHVGDVVAHGVPAHRVGQRGQRLKLGAVGVEQRQRLGVGEPGRIALRARAAPRAPRRAAAAAPRRARPAGRTARSGRRSRPSRRRPRRSRPGGRLVRPVVSMVTCRSVRPLESPQPPSGSCQGRPRGIALSLASPVAGSARARTCAASRGSSHGSRM